MEAAKHKQAAGYTGIVTYTQRSGADSDYTLGGCEATGNVPTTAGYDISWAGGAVTITGFAASGVSCAAGYTGTVTYTQRSGADSDYTLGGCERLRILQRTIQPKRLRLNQPLRLRLPSGHSNPSTYGRSNG